MPGEKIRSAPLLHHALRQHVDLLIGQHAAGALREGRHQLAGNAFRSNLRADVSSPATARYTGLASEIAAPFLPFSPWHAAQFCL